MFTPKNIERFRFALNHKQLSDEESIKLQNLLRNLQYELMKETWQRDWALVEMEDSEYV